MTAAASVRKNLTFLILKHTSSPPVCCRSPVSFSLSLHFSSSSSSGGTQLGISRPTVFDILVHKHNFPAESASRVASELAHLENPEKADSILSFLKESGFSDTQLERIVTYKPRLLTASLDDGIKPKLKIFKDAGFSSDDISRIISRNPTILQLSLKKNIIPSLSVLKGLLGSDIEVARVIRNAPRSLTVNLENNLVPNVEFLKDCGIPMERVRIILSGYPGCFLIKPEVMRKCAEKVKEMGLDTSTKNFIYAIPAVASMSNEAWELKLQAFRDLGFTDSDILTMFRKAPRVLYGSMEKIKKVKELLLATGKFNMCSIVNCPSSLGFSIDKRYRPRLRILGILESRNLIKDWPTLGTICVWSDDRFFKKFVSPYLNEISDVYVAKSSSTGEKEMK